MSAAQTLVAAAGLGAGALAVHAAVNPLRPPAAAVPLAERVSVLNAGGSLFV